MTTVALVGNPNTGKTTLFNRLTGARGRVGNWSGVTVESAEAVSTLRGQRMRVVDLPGIYSLSTHTLDEQVAHDFIVGKHPDRVINIVDASNLERSLYLTMQLVDLGVPLVVVLNLGDVAARRGIRIDAEGLERLLGVPVVATVASRGRGLHALKHLLARTADDAGEPPASRPRPGEVCQRSDGAVCDDSPEGVERRQQCVRALLAKVLRREGPRHERFSDRVDRVLISRWAGIPVFLAVMYAIFWITVRATQPLVGFVDRVAQLFLVDGLRHLLQAWRLPELAVAVLCDGVGTGAVAVASFAPPIFAIFLCLGVLEESGYMTRAAFVMDRMLRLIGLPGKAFIPLLVGFGCTVPAILSTRTLEERRDRVMTMLLTPFMSCGARLPVYTLFALAFFDKRGNAVVFTLYVTGVALAILSGLLLRCTILKGEGGAYILELPTYQRPSLWCCLRHAWFNLRSFVVRAGQVIILIALALTLLRAAGDAWARRAAEPGAGQPRRELSETVGRALAPAFAPMGIERENWLAVIGLLTGVLAKESVIGTLDVFYSQHEREQFEASGGTAADEPFSLRGGLAAAFRQLAVDYGLAAADDAEAAGGAGLVGSLRRHFKTGAAAFAYLLFVLIYSPCLAALAVLGREAGWRWMWFSVGYQTLLAWVGATVFYQAATFSQDPARASFWLGVAGVIVLAGVVGLVVKGRRGGLVPDRADGRGA